MMRRIWRRNAVQRYGTVRELMPIALPIVASQAIDVLMVFSDRWFLSQIGKEPMAATLSGGILTFMLTTLVTGTLAQINPLVAQYRGAGRPHEAGNVAYQGFILAVVFAPLVYLAGRGIAPAVFSFFGHSGVLLQSELAYFEILSLTVCSAAIRQVFANFFVGIGMPFMVTAASLAAVVINMPLAYAWTFGKWGLPRLEIRGAAYATLVAGFLPIALLAARFFARDLQTQYKTLRMPRLSTRILYQIFRFGMPAGLETFVNVGGFTFFTMVMYSYSPDVAAATTIVLNWDMVSFLPLLGISQSAANLVGKYLGAHRKKIALRSAWSALKIGWFYAACITATYISATQALILLFSPDRNQNDFAGVLSVGSVLLRISCLYFFFDATYSVLGGILKGAGDTLWTMVVSNTLMWGTASVVYFFRFDFSLTPVGAWLCLTGMVLLLGILFFLRFRQGKWLHRVMINEKPGIS